MKQKLVTKKAKAKAIEMLALIMQYRIHVDISAFTQPICTKMTGNI